LGRFSLTKSQGSYYAIHTVEIRKKPIANAKVKLATARHSNAYKKAPKEEIYDKSTKGTLMLKSTLSGLQRCR